MSRRAVLAGLLLLLPAAPALAAPEVEAPRPVEQEAERVRSLLVADEWPEALERGRALFREHPDDPRARAVLGRALFRAGRLAECAEVVEPLAGREDSPAEGLVVLARLASARGHGARAAELVERAVGRAPGDPETLYWAGDLHPDRERARELLTRFLERAPEEWRERVEAARGTVALFRALGERRVWIAEQSPTRVELPLGRLWDEGGRTLGFVIEARIGPREKPVRLLLDTGSSGLWLVRRKARKGGFEPLADDAVFGGGGKGRHETERGLLPRLDLGGLVYRDALIAVTGEELEPTGRFHGLLGVSAFGGYRVVLDLQGERLRLLQSDAATGGQPYWWVAGQLLVRASAAGAHGLFVLDTGASATTVDRRFAAAHGKQGPGEEARVRAFGGELSGARWIEGLTVELQEATNAGRPVLVHDLSRRSRIAGVEVSGRVGLDLLDGKRLLLDTVEQRLRLDDLAGD